MGLILDTSILVSNERGQFDLSGFLRRSQAPEVLISAITAVELLHGVERAADPARRARRQQQAEQILGSIPVQPFDLNQARCHARIWADLERRGVRIGAHDLLIAATALALGHEVATLNVDEFRRVTGLRVVDGASFLRA